MFRNVGQIAINLCSVTSHKSKDLIYTTAKVRNRAKLSNGKAVFEAFLFIDTAVLMNNRHCSPSYSTIIGVVACYKTSDMRNTLNRI